MPFEHNEGLFQAARAALLCADFKQGTAFEQKILTKGQPHHPDADLDLRPRIKFVHERVPDAATSKEGWAWSCSAQALRLKPIRNFT